MEPNGGSKHDDEDREDPLDQESGPRDDDSDTGSAEAVDDPRRET